jgi:uncharacterized C2H2 Zn-finger protein
MCKTTNSTTQQLGTADMKPGQRLQLATNVEVAQIAVDDNSKGKQLLAALLCAIKYAGTKIKRSLVVGEEKFNTVLTQCPTCAHICKVQKEHMRQHFFACPSCAAVVNTPSHISKFSYHANKAADHLSGSINRVVGSGSFVLLDITVPKDASPGTSLAVTAPDGRPLQALVPAGLSPGQSFQLKVHPPPKVHIARTNVTMIAPAVAIAPPLTVTATATAIATSVAPASPSPLKPCLVAEASTAPAVAQ